MRFVNNKERERNGGNLKYKIMVLDRQALKVVNSAVKMSELTDENITLVEPLEKRRQPYPSLEAIYFVTPTLESVNRIIEDFTRSKQNKDGRLYSGAHLFFTSALDDRLMFKIKSSPAINFVQTLSEVYLDFLALESQVFILDRPHSLISFFGTEVAGEQITKEFFAVARRIASFCITLGEFPIIRYSTANNFDRITSKIAGIVYEELDRYSRLDSDFPSTDPALLGANRAQLIICDRTIDTISPLLHEFTYQAMANDLLQLAENGTRYRYTYSSNTEGKKDKEVILDEAVDPLWTSIRHSHIADCISNIIGSFNKFLNDNRAAVGMVKGGKGGGTITSINELKETLSSVPQFQDLKSKFSVHISITQECMQIFNNKKLHQLASVEQNMATGETVDGELPKKIESDLIPLLDDPKVALYDKVRLLMLYIISKEGLKDEDRRKLFEHARIGPELSVAITNLSLLGVKLTYSKQAKGLFSKFQQKKTGRQNRGDEVSYELSRYAPVAKKIMNEACDGSLSKDVFPFAKDPAAPGTYGQMNLMKMRMENTVLGSPSPAMTPVTATSLRSTNSSWHTKSAASDTTSILGGNDKKQDEDQRKKGGRVILFIVGGMTYSEMRAAYEVGNAAKKDVIIGSTHLITPTKMIDDIKALKEPLVLPEDANGIGALVLVGTGASTKGNGGAMNERKGKGVVAFFKKLQTKSSSAREDAARI